MTKPPAPADGSPRRGPYAKGVERRREILDRAIEVFAERGSEGTSLRAIGDAIGVSHAALRHYFASREQLLLEVYRFAERRTEERDPEPPGGSVVGMMTHAARRNRAVPGLVQLYSTLLARALEEDQEESREYFAARFEGLRAELAERVVSGQLRGDIRADISPQAAAALVIAASDGLQTQWLLNPSIDVEATLAQLEKLLAPTEKC
ncbi:TetR/AcrR family transcriptional regulator [Streptomyces triticirhizae]|uniref:TetR/AcrR family transcriptional regulator n=1 Tax=Streptomyces triticirhizae TaxID=2483353 RepID=A0A3M2M715_9ACTN|nr:TetR/AcrR family transcriptional regulator [Streptomyces triticirhizae]RMI44643.1 TetR/AcrR family transcriptional regulator [Streptomyces triticirhizae]